MKHIHKTENIRALHGRILDLSREGKLEEAEAAAREGLRTWPDDGGLLVALTEVLARRHDPTCAAEGLRIGARAMVHPDVSGKTRSTAAVNMIFLCMQLGEADRAAQIVRSLPHVWESREIVVPEIADDYPAALREAVRKVLVFLCRKIEAAEDRVPGEIPAYFQLGADFTPEKDDKDMLDVIAGFLAE